MAIQWGMLDKPVNALGSFVAGQEAGEERRTARERRNALASYQSDPQGAVNALMAVGDLDTANALRTQMREERKDKTLADVTGALAAGDSKAARTAALTGGELDLVKTIDDMDADQRERTRELAEASAAVLASAARLPTPEARRAFILQNAARLEPLGYTVEQLQGYDVSDPQRMLSDAMQFSEVKDIIAQYNSDRDFGLRTEQFSETKRSNRANEGLRAQSNATAAYSAQTGRMSFNERKKAGGFGTPGVGGGFVPDADVEIDP